VTHVALIRGINLGPHKRVAMAELKTACERLGFTDVRTLLNSGNVVFSTQLSPKAAAAKIERALERELKVPARVLVLTAAEIEAAVARNSLTNVGTNHSRLFAAFLWAPVPALEALRQEDWGAQRIAVTPRAAYLWCPDGFESSLVKAFHKTVGTGVTVRNWATVLKLHAMTRADGPAPKKKPPAKARKRTR
jgi:uncharacterized protein (DUF1697 family)